MEINEIKEYMDSLVSSGQFEFMDMLRVLTNNKILARGYQKLAGGEIAIKYYFIKRFSKDEMELSHIEYHNFIDTL